MSYASSSPVFLRRRFSLRFCRRYLNRGVLGGRREADLLDVGVARQKLAVEQSLLEPHQEPIAAHDLFA